MKKLKALQPVTNLFCWIYDFSVGVINKLAVLAEVIYLEVKVIGV